MDFSMNSRVEIALVRWSDCQAIQRTMPYCFRVHHGLKVTVINDCFKLSHLFLHKPVHGLSTNI